MTAKDDDTLILSIEDIDHELGFIYVRYNLPVSGSHYDISGTFDVRVLVALLTQMREVRDYLTIHGFEEEKSKIFYERFSREEYPWIGHIESPWDWDGLIVDGRINVHFYALDFSMRIGWTFDLAGLSTFVDTFWDQWIAFMNRCRVY